MTLNHSIPNIYKLGQAHQMLTPLRNTKKLVIRSEERFKLPVPRFYVKMSLKLKNGSKTNKRALMIK
jgi:hypothetical protein